MPKTKTRRLKQKTIEKCLALLYMFHERLIKYECKQLSEQNYTMLEKTIEELEEVEDTIEKLEKETKKNDRQ